MSYCISLNHRVILLWDRMGDRRIKEAMHQGDLGPALELGGFRGAKGSSSKTAQAKTMMT